MKYAGLMSNAAVAQTAPIDDRQVQNNAGGYVYALDQWKRLDRFLILGADANTYYQKARELTRENAKIVEACWAADPARTAAVITAISVEGRAPKNDPAIFALVLGALSPVDEARAAAYAAIGKVCRTGTHLFQFVATAKAMGKGFGRGMKRAVANWYLEKSVDDVAYQVVKYRSRESLTHEMVLDMARPKVDKAGDPARWALGEWIVGRGTDVPEVYDHLPSIVVDHEFAMKMGADESKSMVAFLKDHTRLPWEALPTWANADPEVQKALLPNMGMTAMVRNLGNLTRIGAITPLSDEEKMVVGRLRDADAIRKSRIHPMQVLTALKIYASGRGLAHGFKTPPSWSPSQRIVKALDDAFYLAFANVVPTGKRFFLGLDVSGSMSSNVSGSASLSCCEAAAALSLVIAKTEENSFIGRFNNGLEPVTFGPGSRLDDVLRQTRDINTGGTDCSLPMQYALQKKMKVDCFVVLTDSETYAGRIHPVEALRQYRKATGIMAKLIVVGMTSSGFTIADPADAGMLDMVGFDTAMPALISEFAKG
jgi:60 kDa SS-A/Ro ribonucleoprotein